MFLDKTNELKVINSDLMEMSKCLKISQSQINSIDKINESVFVMGCSHSKLWVYDENYQQVTQEFEAHTNSITDIIITNDKVYIKF